MNLQHPEKTTKQQFQTDIKKILADLNIYLQKVEEDYKSRTDIVDILTNFIADKDATIVKICDDDGIYEEHTKEEAQICCEAVTTHAKYPAWHIKTIKKQICFYSHIHNLNIPKAVEFLYKIKDLQHEGLEKLDEMYKKTPNDFGATMLSSDPTKSDGEVLVKNDMAYKEICNEIMRDGKVAEKYFNDLQHLVEMWSVNKASNKTSNKKNKRKRKNHK